MDKLKTNLHSFPLNDVEVTDEYCKNALEKEINYLLSLQEGRLLAGFYENAGLKTPFVRYGGWESGLIGGHTLGHYLTAVSQGYANVGVSEKNRMQLFKKGKNIVDGLAECQVNSKGEPGFLWGAPPIKGGSVEAQFDNIESGKFDIKAEAWVPWYTMHKILSGLLAAYEYTGYSLALEVAVKLGDWVYERVSKYDKSILSRVLSVEYGGMNDVLYELFALTDNDKYAIAAHAFDEEPLFDLMLTEGEDVLKDMHANTTIPKFIGGLNRYLTLHGRKLRGETVDASRYLKAAQSFWEIVVERHTYVTGGNSEWEHFGADYALDRERTNCNCETCNVYNMLKLSRMLYCVTGDKKYTDYYDTAFINQILSSQNPETGMTTYFQAMASGYFKVFSTPENSFWCCTGSGMESFTKLGDSIYFTNGKNLFIEQYLSSVLRTDRFIISQKSNFPLDSTACFKIEKAEEPFLLCFRVPEWAAGEMVAIKNGNRVNMLEGNGHAALAVKEGDEIDLTIPVEITLKGLPDGKNAFAFLYGGALLSAELGTENMMETFTGVDVAIPEKAVNTAEVRFEDLYDFFENPSRYFVRDGEKFILKGENVTLNLGLHYKRYRERYAIYLRLSEKDSKE